MPKDKNILNEFREYRFIKGIIDFILDVSPSKTTTRRFFLILFGIVIWGGMYAYNHREKPVTEWGVVVKVKKRIERNKHLERIPIMEKKLNQCVLDIDSNTNTVKDLKRSHEEFQSEQKIFNRRIDKNVKDVVKRTYSTKEYVKWLEQRDRENTSYYPIADTNAIPF